jgi:hypothetical protein
MTALGLVALLFVIVPGFIADTLFRSTRGMAKGGEFERVLRSIIWSVFGLGLYGAVLHEPPPYLTLLGQNANTVLGHLTVLPLVGHCAFSCLAAFITSAVAEDQKTRRIFMNVFRRSLNERSAWDVLWHEHSKDRLVYVARKDGAAYWGRMVAASAGTGKRELVLSDPSTVSTDPNRPTQMLDIRFVYLPEDQIAEIRFAKQGEEWNA